MKDSIEKLVSAYFQLAIVAIFGIALSIVLFGYEVFNDTVKGIILSLLVFFTLISILRVILVHLIIYYESK